MKQKVFNFISSFNAVKALLSESVCEREEKEERKTRGRERERRRSERPVMS